MPRKMSVICLMTLFFVGRLFTLWSQRAMADPLPLPIIDHLDDGAPLWTANGSWVLSEANRFGSSGKGWSTTEFDRLSLLSWNRTIDLRMAVTPRLSFT